MADDLTHKPLVLYDASMQRMAAAQRSFDANDFPLTIDLAGLSVECVLQALALRNDSRHDARHNLAAWLARCPRPLQNELRTQPMDEHWVHLLAIWRNHLRYASRDSLLGYLRRVSQWRRLKGDDDARMKAMCRSVLQSAWEIQKKGLAAW